MEKPGRDIAKGGKTKTRPQAMGPTLAELRKGQKIDRVWEKLIERKKKHKRGG